MLGFLSSCYMLQVEFSVFTSQDGTCIQVKMGLVFRSRWDLHSGQDGTCIQVNMVLVFRSRWCLYSGQDGTYVRPRWYQCTKFDGSYLKKVAMFRSRLDLCSYSDHTSVQIKWYLCPGQNGTCLQTSLLLVFRSRWYPHPDPCDTELRMKTIFMRCGK